LRYERCVSARISSDALRNFGKAGGDE
jgi:hypothetical protein